MTGSSLRLADLQAHALRARRGETAGHFDPEAVLTLVEAVQRTIKFLDGNYEGTTSEAQMRLANFLVESFIDA